MFRTTIRLFEYDRLRVGSEYATVDGGLVRFSGQNFDALARFAETCPDRLFELGHRSVRFCSYVGYLQVGELGIEVLPKADRHATQAKTPWRDALLDMLALAYDLPLTHASDADLRLHDATLLELYVRRFLDQVQWLQRRGLSRGYRRVQENRGAFRGRLVVAEHVRRNTVLAQRLYVEHEIYDHDVVINQALVSAVEVLRRTPLPAALHGKLVRVHADLPETCRPLRDLEALDRIRLGRSTSHYAEALKIARLILQHRAPALRAGGTQVFALMFDMNVLWERYIAVLLRRAAGPGQRVTTQASQRFWKSAGRRVRTVKPDIVVHGADGDTDVVFDTKWKTPNQGTPADADLKQMFVYNELYGCERAVLVYPATPGAEGLAGMYEARGHACEMRFVDLFARGKYSRQRAVEEIERLRAPFG